MLTVEPRDKAKLIDPLYKTSPLFWGFVSLLSLIFGWAVYMYIRQITLGLSVTGMQRPVFWGVYMVNFIFFIGISHAGTLISAILRVTGAEWRRPITRVAEAITAFALVVGSLQIIIDMGRPDRLISVLLHGRLQSPILWDVVSVTAYFLGSITYLYLPLIPDVALLRDNFPEDGPAWRKRLYTLLSIGWRGNRTQWLRLEKAIGVMAILIIPIAVSVHTIISWILATTVQPSWHSTIFGPYFVVGAIFSGIGALFIAMTFVRRIMGLQEYITTRQYRNLGYIFITMNAVWAYFTYAEHLTLAAGQEINEFPILASKLWGEFSPGFWSMVALMAFAFWVMVAPQLVPTAAKKYPAFQPRFSYAAAAASIFTFYFISTQPPVHAAIGLENLSLRTLLWFLIIIELSIAGIGLALWLKPKPVDATLLAAIAVIIAMWLERWYIIVPTMTHPYLILFSQYNPTITEVALTAGSIALFLLLFLGFFKIFPIISIWEVAEGRVIEETRALHSVPLPTPSSPSRRFWERSFPKEKKI